MKQHQSIAIQTKTKKVKILLVSISHRRETKRIVKIDKYLTKKVVKIDLKITKKQDLFIKSSADETLFGGAAGGGKSYGQIVDALLFALKYQIGRAHV